MYVIVEDGSRQYRVSEGDRLKIDYREAEIGSRIELNQVLLFANGTETKIGQPRLDGYRVLARVIGQPKEKTVIQQFRRRKNYRRLRGHTQPFLEVRIETILQAGQEIPPDTPPAAKAEPPAKAEALAETASAPATPAAAATAAPAAPTAAETAANN